jgi:hypothetical protein
VSSFRRIISSRANGALSRGPKTAAGKRRSSQNVRRHGCRSRTFLAPEGDLRPAFDQLQTNYISRHQPRTPREHFYVRQMVEAHWRLRCVYELQDRVHDAFFASHPLASLGDDPFSRSINAHIAIVRLPGYVPLWRHEMLQESAISRAFFNLLKEQCKPAAPLNIQKTTNEPSLDFPYTPAKPSKQAVSPPPRCRSRGSPQVRMRPDFP